MFPPFILDTDIDIDCKYQKYKCLQSQTLQNLNQISINLTQMVWSL